MDHHERVARDVVSPRPVLSVSGEAHPWDLDPDRRVRGGGQRGDGRGDALGAGEKEDALRDRGPVAEEPGRLGEVPPKGGGEDVAAEGAEGGMEVGGGARGGGSGGEEEGGGVEEDGEGGPEPGVLDKVLVHEVALVGDWLTGRGCLARAPNPRATRKWAYSRGEGKGCSRR